MTAPAGPRDANAAAPHPGGKPAPTPRVRPVHPRDHDQIYRWLRDPGVQRWWGNAASAEAEIRLALESNAAFCRIIEIDGLAIGYAQAVDAGLTGGFSGVSVPPGSWDCDLFIGSETHRGQGHGQKALDLLVAEVFASTLATACTIVVSVRNERAARAYENIGFRWVTITEDPIHGPCWVMVRDRPQR